MHLSAAVSDRTAVSDLTATRARRTVRPAPTYRTVRVVTLELTVPGTSSAPGRQALHAALGANLRLYTITLDKPNERVTFRIEVTSRTLDQVIGALAGALDSALIGRASTSVIRRLSER